VNLEKWCNLACQGGSEQALVAPYSPHGVSRGLGGYSHNYLVPGSWALSNETVETTKTEHYLKNDAF